MISSRTRPNPEPSVRTRGRPSSRVHRGAAILAAIVALLTASACGPLATVDAPRFDYQRDATYTVPADSAMNVRWNLGLEAVGLTPRKVEETNLTWIPSGTRSESANVANRLVSLADPQVEDGWNLRLWQARLHREEAAGGFAYRLEVEVRVDVPASAWDLTRRVSGRLVGRDGEGASFTFLVRAE